MNADPDQAKSAPQASRHEDSIINDLIEWAEWRFADYTHTRCCEGSYGLVLLFKATRDNVGPQGFALKTVNPAKVESKNSEQIWRDFEREAVLWLSVPEHYNVLPAIGICDKKRDSAPLPVIRMPIADGSLLDWVDNSTISKAERYLALAQACNGLSWLIEQGIEGHGDIKPENLLVNSAAKAQIGFPLIRIADLGWADIWREGGREDETRHAWRPYTAPERIEKKQFVPEKSDVFSLGVVAATLLTGKHPAGVSLNKATKNDALWLQWTRYGSRELQSLNQDERVLIAKCLECEPRSRPTLKELQEFFCKFAEDNGLSGGSSYLAVLTRECRKRRSPNSMAWRLVEAAHVGNHVVPRVQEWFNRLCEDKDPLVRLAYLRGQWTLYRSLSDMNRAAEFALNVLQILNQNPNADLRPVFYPGTERIVDGISIMDPEEVVDELVAGALEVVGQNSPQQLVEATALADQIRPPCAESPRLQLLRSIGWGKLVMV